MPCIGRDPQRSSTSQVWGHTALSSSHGPCSAQGVQPEPWAGCAGSGTAVGTQLCGDRPHALLLPTNCRQVLGIPVMPFCWHLRAGNATRSLQALTLSQGAKSGPDSTSSSNWCPVLPCPSPALSQCWSTSGCQGDQCGCRWPLVGQDKVNEAGTPCLCSGEEVCVHVQGQELCPCSGSCVAVFRGCVHVQGLCGCVQGHCVCFLGQESGDCVQADAREGTGRPSVLLYSGGLCQGSSSGIVPVFCGPEQQQWDCPCVLWP